MRFLFLALLGFFVSACSSIPNAHLTSRPSKVVLGEVVKTFDFVGNSRLGSETILPRGEYDFLMEKSGKTFFLIKDRELKKSWTPPRGKNGAPRLRPGGIALDKKSGLWWVYTLGSAADMGEDGMVEMGIIMADKIDGKYVNYQGLVGRTDESNRMVPVYIPIYGRAENIESITFVGSIPFKD